MSDQNWQLREDDPFGPPTGITRERIAYLTVHALGNCGTHTAVRIAAEEAYAAGVADADARVRAAVEAMRERAALELSRRATVTANTIDTKAAYWNAARSIRALDINAVLQNAKGK